MGQPLKAKGKMPTFSRGGTGLPAINIHQRGPGGKIACWCPVSGEVYTITCSSCHVGLGRRLRAEARHKLEERRRQRTQQIIDELRGTCKSVHDVLEDGEEEGDFSEAIDVELFCCSVCEWWCDRDEESEIDEGVCTDCEDNRDMD